MKRDRTKLDEIWHWIENHRVLSVIAAIGVIVIALGAFTNAVSQIHSVVSSIVRGHATSGESVGLSAGSRPELTVLNPNRLLFAKGDPMPLGCDLVRPQDSLALAKTTYPDGKIDRVHSYHFYSVEGACPPFEYTRYYFLDDSADPTIVEVAFYFPFGAARENIAVRVKRQALEAFKDIDHTATASGKIEWPDFYSYRVGVDDGSYYVVKGW